MNQLWLSEYMESIALIYKRDVIENSNQMLNIIPN